MAVTKSDLFMNWTGVTVTYGATPTVIAIGEVTDMEFDEEIKQEMFYGDNRRRPKIIRNTEEVTKVKLVGGNAAILNTIPKGEPCTITAILNDAQNDAGIGALTFILKNAYRGKISNKGQNNKFATGDVEFTAAGDDSVSPDSDPLTITQATS
ncbi:MAG: hypothetical protein ABI353_08535 [Isosphaeraceae bacterium]